MSRTTKSPLAVAREALEAGRRALPDYAHRNSPKKFTQPQQLFAILVLRQFLRLDYRGTVAFLADWREMREALGLAEVPHYSTQEYAEARLLKKAASRPRSTRRSRWRGSRA